MREHQHIAYSYGQVRRRSCAPVSARCVASLRSRHAAVATQSRRCHRCVAKIPADGAHEALQDVTSIFFNEERNELYVGNRSGVLFVWAQ